MKFFAIVILLISTFARAQVKTTACENIKGLATVDSISCKELVGNIIKTDGFGGEGFQLDSNMILKEVNFDCTYRSSAITGSWFVRNDNTLVLKSSNQLTHFSIFKLDSFYFFIPPQQIQTFMHDLDSTATLLKKLRPLTIDNKTYSVDYMIASCLYKKYYAKEILDLEEQ